MHFRLRHSPPVLAWEDARNRHTIAICDQIQEETYRILVDKFGWESAAVGFRLDFLLGRSMRVAITGARLVCRGPNDDMILECGVISGAEVIVTGDKDLLVLDRFKEIRIFSPSEFPGQNI